MLKLAPTLEEAVMLQTVSRFLPELPLFFMTAVATHLVMWICADADALQLGPNQWAVSSSRPISTFHHPTIPKIISSHGTFPR